MQLGMSKMRMRLPDATKGAKRQTGIFCKAWAAWAPTAPTLASRPVNKKSQWTGQGLKFLKKFRPAQTLADFLFFDPDMFLKEIPSGQTLG